MPTTPTAGMAPLSPSSAPIVSEILSSSAPLPELKKSGAGTFGWVLLILLLLAGGGALAYMMLYKKEPASSQPNQDNQIEQQGEGGSDGVDETDATDEATDTKPAKKHRAVDKHDREERSGKSDRPDKADDADKPDGVDSTDKADKADKAEPKAATADAAKGAAADDKKATAKKGIATKEVAALEGKTTPKEISAVAKKAEAAGDWESALAAYQKLEKAKGYNYPGWAVYKQAWSAFQMNDTANALFLAQRASTMPGNQKPDAKLLYADALFKQGDYKRAKDFYINLRKLAKGEPKQQAQLAKKISACNQKLKLADSDGIN